MPAGIGNIDSTPDFVDLLSANYNLSQFSDCINAGTNAYVIGNKDLNGNPRIVDMEAYEYLPEPCLFIIYTTLIIIEEILCDKKYIILMTNGIFYFFSAKRKKLNR